MNRFFHPMLALLLAFTPLFGVAVARGAENPANRIIHVFYEPHEGDSQIIYDLPKIGTEVGAKKTSTHEMSDGRTATITLEVVKPGDLVVEVTADETEGIRAFGTALRADPGEAYCGLMERVVDGGQHRSWQPGMTEALDLRGQSLSMVVKPTVSLYCPFYISTANYGFFVEGTWPGHFDMADTNPEIVMVRSEGPKMRYHLLTDDSPMKIIRKFVGMVGMPILPPKWAFEPWRWRDDHVQRDQFWDGTPWSGYYNAEVVEDVLMMDALNIPCGVYWVDRPWAIGDQGYEDFEWDRERLPRIEDMIEWLDERGMKFLLWIAPWTLGDMVDEGREKGYFIPSTRHKERGLVDFTNPEAVEWWQGYLKKVIDIGVAGFKLDRSEEIVPGTMDIKTHSGMTTREMRNHYPVMYAKAVHDVFKRLRGDDFVVMPRAGYTGSWKYAIFWGGDTTGSSWGLRSAIIAVQRSAVMGFHVWGSDTGGYHGREYNRDTTCRWLGFSAFCPLMEVGPTYNLGLWNNPWEPSYDAEVLATWSLYAQVHNRIGDYLYDLAKQANRDGTPLVRPMWVQFPDDPECVKWWNEYMLGDDLLVAPLWEIGVRKRAVYLPAGKWVDAWSPETVIEGPARIEVQAPLHKTPVFIREGSSVDLGDLNQTYAEALELAKTKPDMAELVKQAGLE